MPTSSTPQASGYAVDPKQLPVMSVLGPTIQFLTPPAGDDAPCIMRGTIPPGVSIPLHSHADPETFIMIAGEVEGLVFADGDPRWLPIAPGDVFHVPGHAKHAWRNSSRVTAVMLIVSTAKMGRFFRELGSPAGAARRVAAADACA